MKNRLSEKELERLFRNTMDKPDIVYHDEAWSKMEKLLEAEDSKKKRRFFWWWFFGIVGVVIIVGFASWYLQGRNDHLVPNKSEDPSFPISNNSSIVSDEIIDKTHDTSTEMKESTLPDEYENNQLERDSTSTFQRSYDNLGIIVNEENENEKDSDLVTVSTIEETTKESQDDLENSENNHQENEILPLVSTEEQTSEPSNSIENISLLYKIKIPPLIHQDSIFGPDRNILVQESEDLGKWGISLGIGPRLTSTPTLGLGNSDLSVDIVVSYNLSPRLSIYSGIGYISDTYKAGKEDYTPERGFWTRSIAPQSTSANCKILEFPIGVQYFLSDPQNSGIYVMAGISSQFMVREAYYYKYKESYPDLVKHWMGSGENFHLFSSLMVSTGYRKKIKGNIHLSMSPYFNIPLKGVGHGHIKLSSAGLRLGVGF